jgi:hypothetical protein
MRVERPADAEGYGQREECMTTARHTVALIIALVSQSPRYLNTSFEQRAPADRVNNKIKLIKRMAYGFRDDEYFFLRIRAAFPGIP